MLDEILDFARQEGGEDQIFKAKDEDGDLPIHKASYNGNPTALEWIFKTWKANDIDIDANALD